MNKWQPIKRHSWKALATDKARKIVTESGGKCIIKEKNKYEWNLSIIEDQQNKETFNIAHFPNKELSMRFAEDLGMIDIQILEKKKPMTPDEFLKKISQIKSDCYGDNEAMHCEMDDLMFEVLESLGYEEGIKIIKNSDLWYA